MAKKWAPVLPASFTPNWMEVWNCRRPRKEVGLLWSIYHGVVATNVWQAQISTAIDPSCTYCTVNSPETLLHQFTIVPRWSTHGYMPCPSSTDTWVFIPIKQTIGQLLLGNNALLAPLCLKDCNQGRSSSLYLGIWPSRPLGLIATLYVLTPTTSLLLSLNRLYGTA